MYVYIYIYNCRFCCMECISFSGISVKCVCDGNKFYLMFIPIL